MPSEWCLNLHKSTIKECKIVSNSFFQWSMNTVHDEIGIYSTLKCVLKPLLTILHSATFIGIKIWKKICWIVLPFWLMFLPAVKYKDKCDEGCSSCCPTTPYKRYDLHFMHTECRFMLKWVSRIIDSKFNTQCSPPEKQWRKNKKWTVAQD